MIDVCCPELRDIYADDVFGLYLYRHKDDDTPCDFLNKFHITPIHVLKRYISGDRFSNTPGTVAALNSSEEVRFQLCQDLQDAPTLEYLAKKILQIWTFCQETKDNTLLQQLHLEFGFQFFYNVRIVAGTRFIPGEFRALSKPARFTIKKLDARFGPEATAAGIVDRVLKEKQETANLLYRSLSTKKRK